SRRSQPWLSESDGRAERKCASWRNAPLAISQHRSRGAAAQVGQGTDNIWTAVRSVISTSRPFAFWVPYGFIRGDAGILTQFSSEAAPRSYPSPILAFRLLDL